MGKHEVQLLWADYDILHCPDVKTKYPDLYKEICDQNKNSSWYSLSEKAYIQLQAYLEEAERNGYVED